MLWVFCWLLALWPLAAMGQSPIPNDPFLSVPPPTSRPRPVEPAPRPAQPRPEAAPPANIPSGYPVPVGQSFRDCAECPEMMVIPSGTFMMGSPASEADRRSNEGPQRQVTVRAPLAVGRFEVTFAEWDVCVAAGGCSHRPGDEGWGRGNRPVINVSWHDAQEYVVWLSRHTGRRYRLLTEAEWVYAASAEQANFGENVGRTQPVGSYAANPFGLYDMHGNVSEWVQDCYRDSYSGAPTEASQAVEGDSCSMRRIRGGSWYGSPRNVRADDRPWNLNWIRNANSGFRVAKTPGG